MDRNLSSLWPLFIIISALGTVFSSGKERMVKAILFVGSLFLGIYFLTAFIFNADEKYEIGKNGRKGGN